MREGIGKGFGKMFWKTRRWALKKALRGGMVFQLLLLPSYAGGEGVEGIYLKVSGGAAQGQVGGFGTDRLRGKGGSGQMAVGTGYFFSNGVYVGGELFAGHDGLSIKSKESGEVLTSHLDQKNEKSFGGAAQLGFALGKTVIYGRVGGECIVWKRFLYDVDAGTGAIEDPLYQTARPVFIVPGVGWKHRFHERWALGAEFQYALPKRVKKMTSEDTATWSFQRLLIGVSYYF